MSSVMSDGYEAVKDTNVNQNSYQSLKDHR